MHVILRFELEQDIINGRVELRDLPQRWNEKMWDYLGVEVPDDAHGVLQDVHWASGLDRLLLDLPARDGRVGADLGGGARGRCRTSRSRSSRGEFDAAARVARRARPRARPQVLAAETLRRATARRSPPSRI